MGRKTPIFIFLLIFIIVGCGKPEGEASSSDIISYCIADIDGDGKDELLTINNKGDKERLPTGEACGKFVEIYKEFDIENISSVTQPEYSFDFSEIKPSKIQAGDVNGDGKIDINIVVYKKVRFHQVPAKRPFFYNFESGRLVPLWLGSRLSRPFEDFLLRDTDNDGISELISIDTLQDGSKVLALYKWENFGFVLESESEESYKELRFADSGKDTWDTPDKGERVWVIFEGEKRAVDFSSGIPKPE